VHQVLLVGGASIMPRVHKLLSDYFGSRQLCQALDRDVAVAQGCAVLAAMITGQARQALASWSFQDVAPQSLGIETSGGIMTMVVPRNIGVPVALDMLVTPSVTGCAAPPPSSRAITAAVTPRSGFDVERRLVHLDVSGCPPDAAWAELHAMLEPGGRAVLRGAELVGPRGLSGLVEFLTGCAWCRCKLCAWALPWYPSAVHP
jgi:hypothetical protein